MEHKFKFQNTIIVFCAPKLFTFVSSWQNFPMKPSGLENLLKINLNQIFKSIQIIHFILNELRYFFFFFWGICSIISELSNVFLYSCSWHFFYPFVSSICSDILGFILILEMCHYSFFICQLYWKFFNVIGLLKRTPSFFQWFFFIASLFPISLAFLYLLFSSFHLPWVYFAPPFLISWGRNLGNWFRLLFSSATPESPLVLRS